MKRISSPRLAVFFVALLCLLPALAVPAAVSARAPVPSTDGGVLISITTPELKIEKTADGYDRFALDGFSQGGQPRSPALPQRVYNLALPPDASLNDLTVEVVSQEETPLSGVYHPAIVPQMVPDSGAASRPAVQAAAAPAATFQLLPPGQMR